MESIGINSNLEIEYEELLIEWRRSRDNQQQNQQENQQQEIQQQDKKQQDNQLQDNQLQNNQLQENLQENLQEISFNGSQHVRQKILSLAKENEKLREKWVHILLDNNIFLPGELLQM